MSIVTSGYEDLRRTERPGDVQVKPGFGLVPTFWM